MKAVPATCRYSVGDCAFSSFDLEWVSLNLPEVQLIHDKAANQSTQQGEKTF